MAYTFGAATGDDINGISAGIGNIGANSSNALVAGWWYPTTLTATRAYWGISVSTGMRVSGTTSEIGIAIDRTTDALWTSSGAAIAINQWHFIASLFSVSSGGAPAHRLWVGNNGDSPTERTISVTTGGSGSGVGSTTRLIGNTSAAASLAFQGDIGQVVFTYCNGALAVLPTAAFGTITQAEADRIFSMVVLPLFYGSIPRTLVDHVSVLTGTLSTILFDQEASPSLQTEVLKSTAATSAHEKLTTVNGATVATQRQQGPLIDPAWPSKAAVLRRR